MAKNLRLQEIRTSRHPRKREPHALWVIEPADVVLAIVVLLVLAWLQWLLAALPG